MKQFKVGDIVFVSNPDTEYEEEWCERWHKEFFGKVTEINTYGDEVCVEVTFNESNMCAWSYHPEELSHANEIKDMTLEEFSNTYGLCVNATYL